MPQHSTAGALVSSADGAWSVVVIDGRLGFSDGDSTIHVPVEGPLRWVREGEELSFDQVLAEIPTELHGWLALAAVIALRQCLGALVLAVALPPGQQDWCGLADRADPLCAWMNQLADLEGIEVPTPPADLDGGFGAIAAP